MSGARPPSTGVRHVLWAGLSAIVFATTAVAQIPIIEIGFDDAPESAAPPPRPVPAPSAAPAPVAAPAAVPVPVSQPVPVLETVAPAPGAEVVPSLETPIIIAPPAGLPVPTFDMLRRPEGMPAATCTTCGGGYGVFGGDECGCAGGVCHPGSTPCSPCEGHTVAGRFICELYRCICCPDPCYEPRWTGLANAAFFVDGVRPVTQQRFRWDYGLNLVLPDRSEYFWARADGMGLGPRPPSPYRAETRLDYSELSMYTEGATGGLSLFTVIPYRAIDPEINPKASGFGNISIGTKSLIFDCELLQIGFQFVTELPTGNFLKGISNGHVSLEPSLLVGLKVSDDCYLQGQLSEWIPFGLDPGYAGAILHYHASLNVVVARPLPDVQLIGTAEFSGWSFQNGQYTDPVFGPYQQSSGETYLSFGPGVRLVICDTMDIGLGTAFAYGDKHFAEQLFRTEFRVRY